MPLLSSPPPSVVGTLPPGMRLGHIQARLGDLVFGQVDDERVEWVLVDIIGWWGSPQVGGAVTDRPADHGQWVGPSYMGGRTITIVLAISAPDESRRDGALTRLAAAAAFTPTARLIVDSQPQPTWAMVRRSGELLVDKPTPVNAAVRLTLLAPDPRRFGLYPDSGEIPISTGAGPGISPPITIPIVLGAAAGAGGIVLTNLGDLDAPWTAIITGPVTNPQIVNETTGEALRLQMTLPAGQYLRLDSGAGIVRDHAGGDLSGFIAYGTDWFLLPTGESTIRFDGITTGLPLLSMTAYPCWS